MRPLAHGEDVIAQILDHALPKHVLKSFERLTGGAGN
jgi:hypothetical protein